MNLEQYNIEAAPDFMEYSFYSDGPKGAIKKVVRFTKVNFSSFIYYNLGFGDWNEQEKRIDDFVVSNNQDAERVLATVAATVIDFSNHYPDVLIYAQGSTSSRTRRYQMGINKYWQDISALFEVYGLIEDEGFNPFERGTNYIAFVVKKKFSNFNQ
jgi:hypothetical protein